MSSLTPPLAPPSTLLHTLSAHAGPVNTVVYNKGAKYALSGGSDRLIKLWNPKTGKEIKTYKGHGYEVLSIDVSTDNSKFASCGGDRAAFLWDVTSGTVLRRLEGHRGKINTVALYGPEPSLMATGSYDSTLSLWDLKSQSRTPIQTLTESKDSITSVVINGSELLSGSVDGWVRCYDLRMGELRADYIGHPVTSITLSPSAPATSMVISSLDSSVRLMDRSNGKILSTFAGHKNESYVSKAAFGYGEGSVLIGDEEGKLFCWSVLENNKPLSSTQIHKRSITWVETNPTNANEMLTASNDGSVKVWGR